MIKVLYDTNIILDIALQREQFAENSTKAVNVIGEKVTGYVNVLTLVNAASLRPASHTRARPRISHTLSYSHANISSHTFVGLLP